MNERLPCYLIKDLLPQYAEQLLSPESERDVKAHLETCADCRAVYDEMKTPEPDMSVDMEEMNYLKKVRRGNLERILTAVFAAVLIIVCSFAYFRAKAQRVVVNYDEASKTVTVYGKDSTDCPELPAQIEEAKNLDAQFDSFHMSLYLPILHTNGKDLDFFLRDFLIRTSSSIKFIRSYLSENCAEEYPAQRAGKYLDLKYLPGGSYTWAESEDRITLDVGSRYWHAEELYILALLGSRRVEWKQLGYAWYLTDCVDPYSQGAENSLDENARSKIYQELYRAYLSRGGGTDEMTPGDYRALYDAISYLCLTRYKYWGTVNESWPLKQTALYSGPKNSQDPGNDMSISMATSFIAYLVDRFGFDNVSAFCFDRASFDQAFGVDFDTAYADWSAHILELCRDDA